MIIFVKKGEKMRKVNKINLIGFFLVFFVIVVSLAGCGGNSSGNSNNNDEKYGVNITEKGITSVKEIYTNPSEYLDKTVRLEGKIVQECPSGCWFYLEDETGKIYVDIKPSGLSIPPKVGKKVVVEGVPSNRNGGIIIIGKGVEF